MSNRPSLIRHSTYFFRFRAHPNHSESFSPQLLYVAQPWSLSCALLHLSCCKTVPIFLTNQQ